MNIYDPREYIRGIHQILISDKKRIGFLFGAGASMATGVPEVSVPSVVPMTEKVVEGVCASSQAFNLAIREIKQEVLDSGAKFNIETLLSNVEAKRAVLGKGKLNGLELSGFCDLADAIKREIVDLVSVHQTATYSQCRAISHVKIAEWVQKARRRFPIEIYTTNYDYLFELALESSAIPYFDGFSGSYEPFFCPEAVDDLLSHPHLVKLWKIHGSLGWAYRPSDRAVIRDRQAQGEALLIYPSHLKYDGSKKQPYIGLIDRLCSFLQQDDAVLFTCGYAFADAHINERIVTALRRGSNSHVIALYFDEVTGPEDGTAFALAEESDPVRRLASQETAGRLSVYGRRNAVIGGRVGEWKLRSRPSVDDEVLVNRYFEQDPPNEDEPDRWTGTGRLLIPDFVRFSDFLSNLSSVDSLVTS